MPTALTIGPYRFFFFSNEGSEPPHIHVRRDRQLAKFWIQPVLLASSVNFSSHELREVRLLVVQYQQVFLEAWHEHFARK
jgi:hypothetical protein